MKPPALSPREEAEASQTWVHLVWYVYPETDPFGEDVTWGMPLSIHHEPQEAKAEAARRKGSAPSGASPEGGYCVEGPWNLLALSCTGFADAATVRACLKKAGSVELSPARYYSPSYYQKSLTNPPLTTEESRQAAAAMVWTIYYEDRFHLGDARTSYPVAVCLSQAEADAEVAQRGPMKAGGDGHVAEGPSPLVRPNDRTSPMGSGVVREVLRRLTAGEPGPIPAG
jgi:hypothetical protein